MNSLCRTQDRELGFLLVLASAGIKVQVFARTVDLVEMACKSGRVGGRKFSRTARSLPFLGAWMKRRLGEIDSTNVPVYKLSGTNSAKHKEKVMLEFKDG
jgi:hypothetical protein